MKTNEKKGCTYVAPQLTTVTFKMEKGYAASNGIDPSGYMSRSNDEYSRMDSDNGYRENSYF